MEDIKKLLAERAAARAAQEKSDVINDGDTEAVSIAPEDGQYGDEEALESEAALDEISEEAERMEGLRAQVAQFDSDIENTETLLTELSEVHGDAETSAASYTEKKAQLEQATQQLQQLFEDEETKTMLEAEGIRSVDELLVAEGFTEMGGVSDAVTAGEEVKAGKSEVRAKIGERMRAKNEAHAALADENPEMTRTYTELTEGLQGRIEALSKQRKEVFWQTPEGQEAKHEELIGVVTEKMGRYLSSQELNQFGEATPEHMRKFQAVRLGSTVAEIGLRELSEEGGVYGEEDTKTALTEVVKRKIDQSLEAEFQNSGTNRLFEETSGRLEQVDAQWQEFKALVPEVIHQERQLKGRLTAYFDSPEGESARGKLVEYVGLKENVSTDVVVENLLRIGSALDWTTRGHNGESFGHVNGAISVPEYFAKILDSFSEFSAQPRFNDSAYSALAGGSASAPNPELLLQTAKLQQEIYILIDAFMDASNEEKGALFEQIQSSGLKNERFNLESIYGNEALPNSRSTLEASVQQRRQRLEIMKMAAHDNFEMAFEDQLAIRENGAVRAEAPEAVSRIETYERQSRFAQELLPRLNSYALGLTGREQVEVQDGLLVFEGNEAAETAVAEELKTKQTELAGIDAAIAEVNRRAKTEGDGFLGGKKKKREEELTGLAVQNKQKQTELDVVATKNTDLKNKARTLDNLRSVVRDIEAAGFTIEIPSSGTTEEVIHILQETLTSGSLSDEDANFSRTLQALKGKSDNASRRKTQMEGGY